MPSYKKILRTAIFLIVMGGTTGYIAAVDGDWRILLSFLMALLIIFGVDGFEIEIGPVYIKFPGQIEADRQKDKEKDP